MEDDWASPWADADDRSPTEVIRIIDIDGARGAGSAGIDAPQPRIPDSSIAVHTNDPWGSKEHGFGDASAWANLSPVVGSGEIPGVVGGSGLSEWVEPVSVGVPSFVVENAKEGTGLQGVIRNTTQQLGATDEADAWAAGSDWGDVKAVEPDELNADGGLSSDVTPEVKPVSNADTLVEGVDTEVSAHEEEHREYEPTKLSGTKLVETGIKTEAVPDNILPIFETYPARDLTTKHESESERNVEKNEAEVKNEDEDDDDDFGDFADGEAFEDVEDLPRSTVTLAEELPPLPQTLPSKVDISFDIDTSLLNKLYPILTSYPEPPPLEEIIYTTDSRKAWYRLSQSGTIRKDKSSDDDYVRVTWGGSKIQEDVNRIVARWMVEDRSSGGGVALGGSQRLGAMFGWGEGVESIEKKAPPVQLSLVKSNHSHQNNHGFGVTLEQPGVMKSPFNISTFTTNSIEDGTTHSPQAAGFGWSNFDNSQPTTGSQPSSHSNSVKGDEKLPSTPYRASFQGTSSRMSSQPVTPSKSVVSHSPIASSHSSKLSHSLAVTRPSSPSPQSTQRTTEVIPTTPIIPASMESLFPSNTVAPTSVDQPEPITTLAPSSKFDEWGAFENIATTPKIPSTTGGNSSFDEWGAFEDLAKTADSKPTSLVLEQGGGPVLPQPLKTPETKDQTINLNEDEWNDFTEPLPTPKTTISGGLPEKLSPYITKKIEGQPKSEERGMNDWGSLAVFTDPLASKSTVPEKPLAKSSTNTPIELGPKSLGGSGLSAQGTGDWSSFDAFEKSLAPKSSVFALESTRISEDPSRRSTKASSPKAHSADNWGSFEAFESALAPRVKNPPLENLPAYTTQEKNRPTEGSILKAQNIDAWGSLDAFEAQTPKAKNSLQQLGPISSNSATTKFTSQVPPVLLSTPATNEDDDDWGEMVQSPEIPRSSSPFSTVLLPTSLQPTLSPNSTTPRTMSPAPFHNTQPQPQTLSPSVPSTASMFDFSNFEKSPTPEKIDNTTSSNGNGGNDTWDLSFFEGSAPISTPANVSAPISAFSNRASNDLWDAPPPKLTGQRENAKEMEESKLVNQVVDGLPDLSYMLQ